MYKIIFSCLIMDFVFQSLGCLLYAMAFLESPFDKLYAQGGSIALATQSDNVKFPDNSG